jgi:translocation and assembly module TamB
MAAPTAFAVSAGTLSLSPLILTAGAAERLEVAADLALNPLNGQVRAQWTGLNLARANPWLKDMQITGKSHGTFRLGFLSGKRLTLTGSAAGSGTFSEQGHSLTLQRSQVTFDGSEQGLRVAVDLGTSDGGRLKGTFSSTDPLRLVMHEKGELTAELSAIDLDLLKPWLPRDTRLEGHISGRAKGVMLPGQRFALDGTAVLSGGTLHRQRPDGELNLAFSSATASWGWRGEALAGTLALTMAEYGTARSNFQLPVPARFPVAVNPKGPLRASLVGKVQEKGIITTLFPGLVQESSGELDADLDISGTWDVPQVGGRLQLSKAGAYLPTAGIHLKDVQLAARLEKNLILIDSFKAVSGPGHIEGTALITLAGWQVTGYKGTIRGEKFQTVYFPELRILSTPNLSFEGTPQKLKLRGELRIPDMHIVGAQTSPLVTPSSDVVREGRVVPAAKPSPLVMDAQVRVLLGDQVFVKVAGIDAQLGGSIDLSLSSLDRITSKGEIKVVKGRYRTYGVNLEIVRGRLFFAGGPINRPALDFLALRTVGDVRAGVTVAGTLQRPVTKLYSEPSMPDVDVLAYIVLGHPLGSSGEQASLLTQAAGALLTSSKASALQEQLKSHLGLSTLEIQGGVGGTTSHMGYKPLQVTPPGAIPADLQPGVTETVLTVGKYLTPQLYISYGKSLFTGGNLFRLRYDIFKHWQIETQAGSDESGADIYYKLEFK